MALKPPIAKSRITDSVPPVITTSAAPRRMISAASPMAWVLVAQAVVRVAFGPKHRNWRAITKAARFGIPEGRAKGFSRLYPLERNICRFSSTASTPPTAVPNTTPDRSGSGMVPGRLASCIACMAEANAICAERGMRLASFLSI